MNGMETKNVGYFSTVQAAVRLGCSATTVRRAAKKTGVGIYFVGGRLAALAPSDLAALKPHIHETSGNPDWISAGKKPQRRKTS